MSSSLPDSKALVEFAQECQRFYFDGAFATAPSIRSDDPYRSIFIKVQNAVRELSHQQRTFTGNSDLEGLLRSPARPRDRYKTGQELRNFIQFWQNDIGVEPFLKGLWAALYSQCRYRGAGARRVSWELDDAVFLESGPDFLEPAIELLKGSLGFEAGSTTNRLVRPDVSQITITLEDGEVIVPLNGGSSTIHPNGMTDSPPQLSHDSLHASQGSTRSWIFPAVIANDEADALARLFPPSLRSNIPLLGDQEARTAISLGTGQVCATQLLRDDGWRGSRWFQFKQWVRWICGMV